MAITLLPPRVDVPPRPTLPAQPPPVDLELSSGEVNFLYWFIQGGSIMDVSTRWALRNAWGMCPRHAAAWLRVEAAFRHRYLHGLAVLFDDLMERASTAFAVGGPGAAWRLARRLRLRGPCHLCALGIDPKSHGFTVGDRLQVGRDKGPWLDFAAETRPFWRDDVCGVCAGSAAPARCRAHLCDDIARGAPDIEPHRERVLRIARHLARYHDSFRWEHHGTDTVEDRAALVAGAGWCSGWQGLLAIGGLRSLC